MKTINIFLLCSGKQNRLNWVNDLVSGELALLVGVMINLCLMYRSYVRLCGVAECITEKID